MEDDDERVSVESEHEERFILEEFLAEAKPMTQQTGVRKVGPPVDYSFRDLKTLADVCKVDPRDTNHPYHTIPLDIPDSNLAEQEKKENDRGKKTKFVKYCSNAIRLSNNDMSSIAGIGESLKAVIDDPGSLEWIDLSFNYVANIDESILECQNLKVLYLHANNLENIHEIDKLAALPKLKTLTLHGNVLEGIKGYRQYVISVLPQLDYLDFSRITKADRGKAEVWKKLKLIDGQKRKRRPKAAA